MPHVPFAFLRGLLGVLCVVFAHMAGRAWIGARKGQVRPGRFYAWVLRTAACAVVLIYRTSVDTLAIAVWLLSAATFSAGAWAVSHRKPPEDVTQQIFPE